MSHELIDAIRQNNYKNKDYNFYFINIFTNFIQLGIFYRTTLAILLRILFKYKGDEYTGVINCQTS